MIILIAGPTLAHFCERAVNVFALVAISMIVWNLSEYYREKVTLMIIDVIIQNFSCLVNVINL